MERVSWSQTDPYMKSGFGTTIQSPTNQSFGRAVEQEIRHSFQEV